MIRDILSKLPWLVASLGSLQDSERQDIGRAIAAGRCIAERTPGRTDDILITGLELMATAAKIDIPQVDYNSLGSALADLLQIAARHLPAHALERLLLVDDSHLLIEGVLEERTSPGWSPSTVGAP